MKNKKYFYFLNKVGRFLARFTLPVLAITWPIFPASALTPGTLVYRTVEDGKMFGYSGAPLLEIEKGMLKGINPGHVGIYIGQENGEDYIVEALATGVVKTPAKNFVNEATGEKLIGAKLPKEASALERLKAVKIAKTLAETRLAYDFDFHKQKGPESGQWTCVGLTEKIYESAGADNPTDLNSLEYNTSRYRIDITPDGFDNKSIVNEDGDCFSKNHEFSKISRRTNLILPLPEIIGYNAGLEYQGERYIFLPYTQFLQPSLRDEKIDIELSSSFASKEIRGKTPVASLLLRWSLVNNPLSSLKIAVNQVASVVKNLAGKIFENNPSEGLVLLEEGASKKSVNPESKESARRVIINQGIAENNKTVSGGTQLSASKNQSVANKKPVATIKINNSSQIIKTPIEDMIAVASKPALGAELAAANNIKVNSSTGQLISSNQIDNQKDRTVVIKSNQAENKSSVSATIPAADSNVLSKVTYNSSSSSLSKIIAGIKPSSSNLALAEQSGNNNTNNQLPEPSSPPAALISKIYATDNNDFIELYNPLDYGFDLAEAGFRLERSKTAEDPSLVMRIGNLADGAYPGGTFIQAKGYYLIVRDDASPFYLAKADAIASRSEFSWTGSGYIIYLGKGSISSSADEDIIDAVGFGASKYYQGSEPAPAIEDNYFLNRVANNGNNRTDFNLQIINDPAVSWDDISQGTSSGDTSIDNQSGNQNNDNQNSQPTSDNQNNSEVSGDGEQSGDQSSNFPEDFKAFVSPEPIVSSGINHFWHFDECYGPYKYSVGRFDCALELYNIYPIFTKTLSPSVDFNQASISFYYRNSWHTNYASRLNFKLKNDNGQEINILLEPGLFQAEGLPRSAWRYFGAPVSDNNDWHHFALVVNRPEHYWAAYFDGVEKYRQVFIETMPNNFSYLEFLSGIGSISIDELAIWGRALTPAEIAEHFYFPAPFSPIASRLPQLPAQLKYFWDFNEGHKLVNEGGGRSAIDLNTGSVLDLPENPWVWRGWENTGIINRWGKNLTVSFPEQLARKDLSLAFWWRSRFYPQEGRSLVSLEFNNGSKFGLAPDLYRRNFYFNDQHGVFSDGQNIDFPFDEAWHHLAMTYDSYRYQLKFYVDGEEKKSLPFFWIKENELPTGLSIKSELNSVELDDLGIWEGTLTPGQIKKIYQDSRTEPLPVN